MLSDPCIAMDVWRGAASCVGIAEKDPEFGVDRLTSGMMEFPSGQAVFTCSTQMVPYQRMQFLGTKGRIEIEIPFNAPPDKPTRIFIDDGRDVFGGGIRMETIPICDQYTLQGDAFSRAIREDGEIPVPLEDAIGNMAVIEAVFRAADSGDGSDPKRRKHGAKTMAIRTVLQLGDPGLREVARPVENPTAPEISSLVQDLGTPWRIGARPQATGGE